MPTKVVVESMTNWIVAKELWIVTSWVHSLPLGRLTRLIIVGLMHAKGDKRCLSCFDLPVSQIRSRNWVHWAYWRQYQCDRVVLLQWCYRNLVLWELSLMNLAAWKSTWPRLAVTNDLSLLVV